MIANFLFYKKAIDALSDVCVLIIVRLKTLGINHPI